MKLKFHTGFTGVRLSPRSCRSLLTLTSEMTAHVSPGCKDDLSHRKMQPRHDEHPLATLSVVEGLRHPLTYVVCWTPVRKPARPTYTQKTFEHLNKPTSNQETCRIQLRLRHKDSEGNVHRQGAYG